MNDPKTKQVMVEILEERAKKGKLFGFGTNRQYRNWFNRQTPLRQAAIQAMSANGKSINPKLLADKLIPKMGAIKFVSNIKGFGKGVGKALFGSKVRAVTTLASLGLPIYNAIFDSPEEETEEDTEE